MDLVLHDSVLRLCKALEFDDSRLLASESPEELVYSLQTALGLELPDNPWSLQYYADQTTAFITQTESDYNTRQQQYESIDSQNDETGLMRYARNLLLIEILRLACFRRYESIDQAQAVKTLIRDQVEQVMLNSSDAMYMHWRDWKTLLIEAIEQQEETLPHVIYVERAVSLPALLIAYQQYGNTDRESDILTRNGIRHPGFCPVASPIELLSQ